MHRLEKTVHRLFIAILVVFAVLFFLRNSLPSQNELVDEVAQIPIQKEINKDTITIPLDGSIGEVDPLYSYELYGLVVASYDSDVWYDQFHKDDPLNTKDLCVVWGGNATEGKYLKGKYSHGEFTCFWNFKSYEDYRNFNESEIANNHLIPADESLADKIKEAQIGDQIHFKGYISSYSIISEEDSSIIFSRGTSTIREDTGDNSCETVYVTDFEIVKKNPNIFALLYQYAIYALIFLTAISLLMWAF
ncbi:hypothetical protein KKB10_03875 [Patescibacteria group bacterium]|nr:hypothetical protein [Patescibacteria group bacterium]MBU1075101.1 hypothetical protein [Patescibacteria group bacterium]MBU1952145.1 hypothetical protein [Patescibacteria group bacterium]